MKEIIEKKLDQLNLKFWPTSQNVKKKIPSFDNVLDQTKPLDKYKIKLTKLEKQYTDIQMAVRRQNSILRGILSRNLYSSQKNYSKPTNFLIIKCLLTGGIVYGTIYAGIWGSQTDTENMVQNVTNSDLDKVKTDLITAYNNVVKYLGQQAHNLPENSIDIIEKTKIMIFDFYQNIKSKYKSD